MAQISTITELTFDTNSKTYFDSNILIGNGTYIFKNINKKYPIAIVSSDINNIQFIGNSHFLYFDKNGKPLNYFVDGKTINFYFGKVSLKVLGKFESIGGYYIYDEENDKVIFNSFTLEFDNTNNNGSTKNDYLDYFLYTENENGILYNYNLFLEGNSSNGIKIDGYDKYSLSNKDLYSYVRTYIDFDKNNYLYVGSNNVPNYFPQLDDNNLIIGKWKDYFNLIGLEAEAINYGIDEQNYGYKSFNLYTYGKPFKIPSNPIYVNQKNIPINYIPKDTNIQKESFWYKNNSNWQEIMVDKKYDNTFLNDKEILTPIGNIGVMINGISIYNHINFYNNINEELLKNFDSFTINRILNKTNDSIFLYNTVNVKNFDNHGGTIDKNNNYNYNKYPVGLEAMIKLGTYNSYFIDESNVEIEQKVFYLNGDTNGIYYLNISNDSFYDSDKRIQYNFSLEEQTDTTYDYKNCDIEMFMVGKSTYNVSYNSTLIIKISNLPENEVKYNLKIGTITYELSFKNKETTDTNEANSIYYLKYIDAETIHFYVPENFLNSSFIYKGYLNKINSKDLIENEIILYMKTMLKLAEANSDNLDTFHSPLLGWAFDGFPIYGQIGYKDTDNKDALKLLKSSYNTQYQYVQGSGDLDLCNGIFCPTPEFPEGIYHYVCTLCLDDENEITFKTYIDGKKSLYAYPYIIGAYKGVPEISNFDFEKTNSYFKNNYSSDSSNGIYTYSKNNNSSNNLTYSISNTEEEKTGNMINQSSLELNNQTNYDINFRSLKSINDKYNGEDIQSINVSQDENYIELKQGSKPYIWNFTGSELNNDYFGKTNNNYGNTLNNLIGDNDSYLKAYGSVSKYKYLDEPNLGNTVIYYISNNDVYVQKTYDNKPILGIVVNIDDNNNICYVCTNGLCEINNISGTLSANDLLKSNNDGTISKIDNDDNNTQYLIGTYIGSNNDKHLINIQPSILVF
uniref:YHYH domain-containing protein n=1 Tax=Mimiviridae sp. ChoanoV1 TaxID=2596887 RepID=A0A5B8IDC5_9VIRU|nr:hypothetical protein 1_111 [Mimiviridae sp. ChoanoV1]